MSPEVVDDGCMNGSITSPGMPPDGKDPSDPANEAMLPAWGLPHRPTGDCAIELWRQMLSGARIEPAQYECDLFRETPRPQDSVSIRPMFTTAVRRLASRTQNSRNWSGAWILPRGGHRFVAVWGAWTVPEIQQQESDEVGPPVARGLDAARCSQWIGIGGHRRHSKSLPQVGTMAAVSGDGTARYYAWFQWWEPTLSYGPLRITNLDVSAGDRIIAAVTAEAHDKVRLHIRNQGTRTQGARELRSIEWQANSAVAPVDVDGKSAEWVVEQPSWLDLNANPHLFRLPRFASLRFDCCQAEAAAAVGAPALARDLTGARLVRMVGPRKGAPGSRFLAVPEKQGPGVLDVAIREP